MIYLFAINILFFLTAIVMTVFAPCEYSHTFCASLTWLFIFQNLIFFLFKSNQSIICFEFFFAVSFFFVYFVHPTFYYPNKFISIVYNFKYNESIISKSTAIAYLAFTSYMLALTFKDKSKNTSIPALQLEKLKISNNNFIGLLIISLILFLTYIACGGISHMKESYSGTANFNEVGLFSYISVLFQCFILIVASFAFTINSISSKTITIAYIFLIVCLILFTGSRTLPLRLVLLLLLGFDLFVKRFKKGEVFIFAIFGTLILYFTMQTRNIGVLNGFRDFSLFSNLIKKSPFDLFSDLIMNNRNLYLLVDYADNIGHTGLSTQLRDLLSPVPFLFKFVNNFLNIPNEFAVSGSLPTFITFGDKSEWGMGTSLVGEAYLSFGTIGTVISFMLIGLLIRKTRIAMAYNKYALLVYFLCTSQAIFYPRSTLFYDYRILVWSLLTLYICDFGNHLKNDSI